ncbi:hypothetical protein [Allosphingosinicella deserti]|nr:hypothetical protein [Sphingomonas deserti]
MERFLRAIGFDYTRRVHAKRIFQSTDWLFWGAVVGLVVAIAAAWKLLA